MKLFESIWRSGYDLYERVYDAESNSSIQRKVETKAEWYYVDDDGVYENILNSKQNISKTYKKVSDLEEFAKYNADICHIRDNYWGRSYNQDPRIWYMDIETRAKHGFPTATVAPEAVCLIQIYDNKNHTMYVLGDKDWKYREEYSYPFEVKFVNCGDETKLFKTFFKLIGILDPLVIYAWNGEGFDWPYLYNRAKRLGFDGSEFTKYSEEVSLRKVLDDKDRYTIDTRSLFWVDLMEVYKKFTFTPRTSYSLDNIAYEELGERKINHDEYLRFDDFYTGEYQIPTNPTDEQLNSPIYKAAVKYKETGNEEYLQEVRDRSYSLFVHYGIVDTFLIYRIDNKLNFSNLMLSVSQRMGVLFSETMGTVKPWGRYILNKSYTEGKIIPKVSISDDIEIEIKGGYVMDPSVGKHEWIISADVNSMYPLLGMVGFNMSPETYVPIKDIPDDLKGFILKYHNDENEETRFEIPQEHAKAITDLLKKYNLSLAINGAVFKNEEVGMVPRMVKEIYDGRKIAKKTKFKYEQQKVKIKELLHKRGLDV